jgi:hypothetical protein
MKRLAVYIVFLLPLLICLPAGAQVIGTGTPPLPINQGSLIPSNPVPAITTVDTAGLGLLTGVIHAVATPVDMKLLILATDGTEPGLAALQFFLDYLGTPYQVVLLANGQPLPPLDNGVKGFYQGIILTIGNLAVCNPACHSVLDVNGWAALDSYTRNYHVRVASYYTCPEARYGMAYVLGSGMGTTDQAPGLANLTSAGASVFNYLQPNATVKIAWAWTYLATAVAANRETTTPILQIGGSVVGVTHTSADGREYLALTMDNNPYLLHSATLNYGIIRWITKGLFLGSRKTYMTPQVDDHFIADDMFDSSQEACIPVGFATDRTYVPPPTCPQYRITGQDLSALGNWQQNVNANPQFAGFEITLAFNGVGTTTEGGGTGASDSLVLASQSLANQFFWVSHTYDHEELDCYQPVPNSGVCTPATYAQSLAEISQNVQVAQSLGLPNDPVSMVTPSISGLTNPNFLSAAASQGIQYLVSDLSRPEGSPASPNTGIWNQYQRSIFEIPRRPTNIFYNTATTVAQGVGSEPEEYNYFYGPNGISRIGGPGGPPFFTTNQTWDQIRDRESDAMLLYLLRGEQYPLMFHQTNLFAYDGVNSLLSDVVGSTLSKFAALSQLPVISKEESDLGVLLQNRMAYNASQVHATLTPGVLIKIDTVGQANIPVTGLCADGCETYGPDKQSLIPMSAGSTRLLPLVSSPLLPPLPPL